MIILSRNHPGYIKHASRYVFIALFFCFVTLSSPAQRRERLVDSWRPTHYDVNLTFTDPLAEITARTDISLEVLAQNLTKVDFDFGEMPIDSVLVSGTAANFERTAALLN